MKNSFTILLVCITSVAFSQTDITLDNNDGIFFKNNSGITDNTKIIRRTGNALSIQYELNNLRFDALDNKAVVIKNNLDETVIQLHPNGNSAFEVGSFGLGLSGGAIDDDYRLHISRGNQSLIKMENSGSGSGSIAFANSTGMQSRLQFSSTGGMGFQKYDGSSFNTVFQIKNNGEVGIGTTNPSSLLEIESNDSPAITINNKKTSSTWSIDESYGELLFKSDDGSGLGAGVRGYIKLITHNTAGGHGTMIFGTRNSSGLNEQMRITHNNLVGIGTSSPTEKLEVNGTIRSKEVKVEASGWPDYVFEEDYDLRSLDETEAYIKENKHLPEIPSAKEIEANGVQLGEMNMLMLKKIEELTLYIIEQEKRIEQLENKN